MKKATFLFAIIFALFALPVLAQEAGDTTQPAPTQTAAQQPAMSAEMKTIVAEAVKEEARPEDVKKDEAVKPEDLGVKEARILPDSPFYIFKDIGRTIQSAITFNPIKKAELQLQHANTKIIEAQQLFNKEGDEKADKVAKVIEGAQKKIENIAKNVEKLKEAKKENKEDAAGVDKFLDKLADHEIKQQKVMQKLEEKVPEKAFVKIKEAREKSLEHFGKVMTGVAEKHEEIGQRLARVMDQQKGSNFKEFKNLEILKAMKEKMPENVQAEINKVEEKQMKELVRNAEKERDEFKKYVENIGGASDKHIEILDQFKMRKEVPLTFIKQLNVLKEKTFSRFEGRFKDFKTEAGREQLISGIKGDSAADMKTRQQLLNRLPDNLKVEVKKADDAANKKFREKFKNDPEAMKKADLFEKLTSNPDAMDFVAIEKLEKSLTPEQQKFVQTLKQEGAKKMTERFAKEGGDFEARFIDPTNPQSLKVLEGLKGTLPPEAMFGIGQAIDAQRKGTQEHMSELKDPKIMGHIFDAINIDPALKKSFEAGDPQFFQKMGAKRVELEKMGKKQAEAEQKKIEAKYKEFIKDPKTFKGEEMPQFMMDDFNRGMKEQQQGPGFFGKMKDKFGGEAPPPGTPQEKGFIDRIKDTFKKEEMPKKIDESKIAVPEGLKRKCQTINACKTFCTKNPYYEPCRLLWNALGVEDPLKKKMREEKEKRDVVQPTQPESQKEEEKKPFFAPFTDKLKSLPFFGQEQDTIKKEQEQKMQEFQSPSKIKEILPAIPKIELKMPTGQPSALPTPLPKPAETQQIPQNIPLPEIKTAPAPEAPKVEVRQVEPQLPQTQPQVQPKPETQTQTNLGEGVGSLPTPLPKPETQTQTNLGEGVGSLPTPLPKPAESGGGGGTAPAQ